MHREEMRPGNSFKWVKKSEKADLKKRNVSVEQESSLEN